MVDVNIRFEDRLKQTNPKLVLSTPEPKRTNKYIKTHPKFIKVSKVAKI